MLTPMHSSTHKAPGPTTDSDKQAVIGDAKAGTYAQFVKAAEKCPARCIHPGLPLDPNETDVEGLIERAKPFN